MKKAIGIDIGGTKTAIAIVNENGDIIEKDVLPTDTTISPEDMIGRINEKVAELIRASGVPVEALAGIGIGAPGTIDMTKGEIVLAPNLPKWRRAPIVPLVQEKFPVPVVLGNDANAAAVAEKWVGAAKNSDHFIYITISTGIGGGIFSNGKLFTGFKGNSAEIGHMVIEFDGPLCGCGQKGCFEAVASGTAIAKHGSAIAGRPLTTKEVFELYRSGDAEMTAYVESVFQKIGAGVTSLVNILEPEMVVLGGGVTNVGEPLFQAVRQYVSEHAISVSGKATRIVPSELSQDTGVIGAAALVLV
ncbi:ROK family protein [Tuberibacillus calidus]|jgi:glucokinase|uniref:ROK family protein n=1 Tax=Tuberibacillus calidus TaxID=340097 RepID=UPI0004006A37|nr:ROK family protein [Tuberibacillus calidus]